MNTTTKTRKATKNTQIDHHGFIANTKGNKNMEDSFGISSDRATEIQKLLRGWDKTPGSVDNISDVINQITTLPTENERLYATFSFSAAKVMSTMTGGLLGGLGAEDTSDVSDTLDDDSDPLGGLGDPDNVD